MKKQGRTNNKKEKFLKTAQYNKVCESHNTRHDSSV